MDKYDSNLGLQLRGLANIASAAEQQEIVDQVSQRISTECLQLIGLSPDKGANIEVIDYFLVLDFY